MLKDVSTESISYQTAKKKTVLNDFSPGTTVYQIEGKNCKKNVLNRFSPACSVEYMPFCLKPTHKPSLKGKK